MTTLHDRVRSQIQFSVLVAGLYYQFLSNRTICHNLLKWMTVNNGKSHKFVTFSQPTINDHIQIVVKVEFLLISEVSVCEVKVGPGQAQTLSQVQSLYVGVAIWCPKW